MKSINTISKMLQVLKQPSSKRGAITMNRPSIAWNNSAMRMMSTSNRKGEDEIHESKNQKNQNVFTKPSKESQKESTEESEAATSMFEDLKEPEVDTKESAAKNISLSLLQVSI